VAIILGCYNETKSTEWPFLVRSLTYVYILMITEQILTLATGSFKIDVSCMRTLTRSSVFPQTQKGNIN